MCRVTELEMENSIIPATDASATENENASTTEDAPPHATDEEPNDDVETVTSLIVEDNTADAMAETVSSTTMHIVAGTHTDTAPPASKAPALLELALAAVAGRGVGKSTSGHSDMVIVLDMKDLAKTVVLDFSVLARQIPGFDATHHLHKVDSKSSVPTSSGVRHLFVLESCAPAEGMPTLERKALNTEAPPVPVDAASTNEDEVANANDDITTKIKNEPTDDDQRVEQSQTPPQDAPINWVKAYEVFLRTVGTTSLSVRAVGLPSSAKAALPLLPSIVAISERYDCVATIGWAFKSLSNDWISNRKLYPAIAAAPAQWLALAIKLESELVYKEAFVHVVGQYPDVLYSELLPESIKTLVTARAQELKIMQYEVNQQLLTTTLRVPHSAMGRLNAGDAVVSQHHRPAIYNTVNIWRDWISEHLSYIRDHPTSENTIQASQFCDHPNSLPASQPECLTIAGFYRILHRAGDAYLDADEVMEKWNAESYEGDSSVVRPNLAQLKAQAKKTVAPLVRSTLQLAEQEREVLTYLTCMEVGKVPWAAEDDVDEDVEMED